MHKSHDSLGRRNRMDRQPTGKIVRPTPRDLVWFRKLHEHGPLASDYLHAFTEKTHRNPKRARERLTDLFNETATPHGDAYLDRPIQQFATIDGRYHTLVHDLTDAGRAALQDSDGSLAENIAATGPWLHRHMVASITSSIEIGTLHRPDLRYIPQSELLRRRNVRMAVPVHYRDPGVSKAREILLEPDAMFGLAYETDAGPRYRIFFVEADRGTEPLRSKLRSRKTISTMLLAYRSLIEGGHYKTHFGLNAPTLLLFVAATPGRLITAGKAVEKIRGKASWPWFLMQRVPGFGPVYQPPGILSGLMDEPWERSGTLPPMQIDHP